MTIVTGATGHIGNTLIRELTAKGEKVRALIPPSEDRSPLEGLKVELVESDVRNLDSLMEAFKGCDIAYHLAGVISIVPGKRDLMHRVNVGGARNVVEACLTTGVKRLIYTSSIHAIAEPSHGIPIDETLPFDPDRTIGDYGRSKALAAREVLKGIGRGLNAVIVCPTGVTGPYDYRVSEMGQLITDFLKRKLKAYVAGSYDFVDVRDVVKGHILAGQKGESGQTYILSGERITVAELLSTLEEITGVKAPSLKLPRRLARAVGVLASPYYWLAKAKPLFTAYSIDVLASNSLVSSEKARRELGYSSRPIKESIEDAIEWFREAGMVESLTML